MLDRHHTAKLRSWIPQRLGTDDVIVDEVHPLGGGSIQENWRVRCILHPEGKRTISEFVLRKDAPATIASSRPRSEEFAILAAAYRAGVCVPKPIGFCADPDVIGAPFAMMGLVEGVGLGPRIAKDKTIGGDRARLAERLGRELAKIHAIRPPPEDLAFLGEPDPQPALAEVRSLRTRRAAFYRGYETESGVRIDDAAVRYWEVVAHLRWIVVALEQGHRHLSGLEPSLELALTGRIVPELELAILRATGPDRWSQ